MIFGFDILTLIIGAITGGAVGSLVTYSFTKQQNVKGSGTVVDQSDATAGGDIVGRDKNKD